MKQYNNATIDRAHDVRTLRVCQLCHGIGNLPSMLLVKEGTDFQHWHGRCFVKTFGVRTMKKLLANR